MINFFSIADRQGSVGRIRRSRPERSPRVEEGAERKGGSGHHCGRWGGPQAPRPAVELR